MVEKEDIDIISGDFVVHTNRHLSDEKESITAEIELSEDLKKLFNGFACKNQKPVTEKIYNHNFERYAIKKTLKSSVSWGPAMSLLFSVDLLDNQKIKIKFDDINTSTDLVVKIRRDAKILAEKVFALSCLDKGHSNTLKLNPNY